MTHDQAHAEAQKIATELWQSGECPTRERATIDAFDAVVEATGIDLAECRRNEIQNARNADAELGNERG